MNILFQSGYYIYNNPISTPEERLKKYQSTILDNRAGTTEFFVMFVQIYGRHVDVFIIKQVS